MIREAPAATAESAQHSFVTALNDGDLEAACAYFASHACLITADATAIHLRSLREGSGSRAGRGHYGRGQR